MARLGESRRHTGTRGWKNAGALSRAEVVEKLFVWARDGRTDATGTPEPELLMALLRDYAAELAPP